MGSDDWVRGSRARDSRALPPSLLVAIFQTHGLSLPSQVIAINVQDPLASLLNDIDDVQVHLPGCLEAIHRWLKLYKSPAVNTFAFGGKAQDRKFAIAIIEETHKEWRQLIEDRGKSATVAK